MEIITDIPKLRTVSREVTEADDPERIAKLLAAELDAVHGGYLGYSLAAIQLGFDLRMFVMRYGQEKICIVNPVITKARKTQTGPEMCLSLPGVKVVIERPLIVTVKGVNQYFYYVKYKLQGLSARAACHEIDHLDGKLIIDYEVNDGECAQTTR